MQLYETVLSVYTICFCPWLSLLPPSTSLLLSRRCNKDMEFSCNQTISGKEVHCHALVSDLSSTTSTLWMFLSEYFSCDSLGLLLLLCSCWTKSLLTGICIHLTTQQQVIWWWWCVLHWEATSKPDNRFNLTQYSKCKSHLNTLLQTSSYPLLSSFQFNSVIIHKSWRNNFKGFEIKAVLILLSFKWN